MPPQPPDGSRRHEPRSDHLVCCLTVGLLYKACKWLINRAISRRVRDLTARRNRLERDLAAHRSLRTAAIETQPGDPYSDDRIAAELVFIPHQTRRTEDNQ